MNLRKMIKFFVNEKFQLHATIEDDIVMLRLYRFEEQLKVAHYSCTADRSNKEEVSGVVLAVVKQ